MLMRPVPVSPDVEPTLSPIAVGDGFGLLHRASVTARCGVVLCSPWGIDELSARKILFRLGHRLAAAGFPALRFDYPGTADAIDGTADGFDAWVQAASEAGDRLKTACGVERIIFAGLGVGAAVALLASATRDDVAGLVLAAPVIGGRRYLREISLGAPVVEEGLGLCASQRPEGVTIGGIIMPPAVAASLKSIDLMNANAGSPKPMLVVQRPAQPQDAELADRFAGMGWPVARGEFAGYAEAMDNPTIAVMPERVIDGIVEWIATPAPAATTTQPGPTKPVTVNTRHGTDEPICFGNLFGVLTHPVERTAAPTVVFLNSGYDHHAGWAYQWARAAGALAASGIASLRFDMANIGDSAARAGAPEQVLYSDGQQADISAAIDMLEARGEGPVLLVGRCSGGFAALHAAARDQRVSGAVVVNPLRLVWDPDEDVEVAIRVGPRSMADYRQRALSGKIVRRVLAGDVDVRGAVKGLATQVWRRLARRLAPLAGSLSKTTRLRRRCHAMFETVSRRGGMLHMVCSERDASLEQMVFHFGGDFSRLRLFPGASLTTVPNADHNMTPQAAQDAVVDVISEMARRLAESASLQSGMSQPVPMLARR
jgi:pimeloyl-ACP methyl ester carboxylesterase